jgi:hypothetical protein
LTSSAPLGKTTPSIPTPILISSFSGDEGISFGKKMKNVDFPNVNICEVNIDEVDIPDADIGLLIGKTN